MDSFCCFWISVAHPARQVLVHVTVHLFGGWRAHLAQEMESTGLLAFTIAK